MTNINVRTLSIIEKENALETVFVNYTKDMDEYNAQSNNLTLIMKFMSTLSDVIEKINIKYFEDRFTIVKHDSKEEVVYTARLSELFPTFHIVTPTLIGIDFDTILNKAKITENEIYFDDTEIGDIVNLNKLNNDMEESIEMEENKNMEKEVNEAVKTGEEAEKIIENNKNAVKDVAEETKKNGTLNGLSSLIGHVKHAAGRVSGEERKAYDKVIAKLCTARTNFKEANKKEDIDKFKKVINSIMIGFIKAAELILGTLQFSLDFTFILARYIGRIVKDIAKETKVMGTETKGAFEKDILSVFKK